MGNCCGKRKRENGCNDRKNSGDQILSPFSAEWKFKIDDLRNLSGCLYGKCHYDAKIPGLQYFVSVFRSTVDSGAWILLNVNGSNERNIRVECTFYIPSANVQSKNLRCIYKSKYDGILFPLFYKTSELFDSKSKLFVDEELTIIVQGSFRAPIPSVSKILTPISFKWKIKKEDLKEIVNKGSNDGHLCSGEISVSSFSHVSYHLSIYPNKIREGENEAQTELYLNVETGNEKKIEAIFDFSIDSVNYNHGNQSFWKEFKEYKTFLCSTENLFDPFEKYFVDGILTINFNGFLMAEETRISILK
uniref:MATH domain-containing protein n=1 Tax=Panagrolaimus davidi TaxID=227884 RepID=A0A914PHN4_9BILA